MTRQRDDARGVLGRQISILMTEEALRVEPSVVRHRYCGGSEPSTIISPVLLQNASDRAGGVSVVRLTDQVSSDASLHATVTANMGSQEWLNEATFPGSPGLAQAGESSEAFISFEAGRYAVISDDATRFATFEVAINRVSCFIAEGEQDEAPPPAPMATAEPTAAPTATPFPPTAASSGSEPPIATGTAAPAATMVPPTLAATSMPTPLPPPPPTSTQTPPPPTATPRDPVIVAKVIIEDAAIVMPSAPIAAGSHLWEVANFGRQPHLVSFIRVPAATAPEEVRARLLPPEGAGAQPDLTGYATVGGIGMLSPGFSGWVPVELRPGAYVAFDWTSGTIEGFEAVAP